MVNESLWPDDALEKVDHLRKELNFYRTTEKGFLRAQVTELLTALKALTLQVNQVLNERGDYAIRETLYWPLLEANSNASAAIAKGEV